MIKEMHYDPKYISLVTELAAINPQLIFKNNGEQISVKGIESQDKSVCFFLDAPTEAFGFESESLAVLDFKRLVSYYETFNKTNKDEKLSDTPVLSVEYKGEGDELEAATMHIKSSKVKASFKHRLANEDVIVKPNFNKVKFPSVDAKLALSQDQIAELNKMMSLTAADRIKWAFDGANCVVTLFNTRTNDTYENTYLLESAVETAFDFTTFARGFGLLPKGSYNLEISKAGIMSFKQEREDALDLVLYIAKTGK